MSFESVEKKIDTIYEKIEQSLIEQAKIGTTLKDHIKEHCDLKRIEAESKKQELDVRRQQNKRLNELDEHVTKVKFVAKYIIAPITGVILVGLTKLLFSI